jgi:hypothetical protein
MQRRNFRALYQRQSTLSNKPVISMYAPDSPYTVYSSTEWWHDNWDGLTYGRAFDFNKSFFEQFHVLNMAVPKEALYHVQCDNSDYANLAFKAKNCYLVFGCVENENCLYGHIVWHSKDCIDGLYLYHCELCYQAIDCVNGYKNIYSTECTDCTEIYFSYNCRGCRNCFGCVGLVHKQWQWFNKQLTEEQYHNNLKAVLPFTPAKIAQMQQQVAGLREQIVVPAYYGIHNENVSGNHIYYSSACRHCFDVKHCEQSNYIFTGEHFVDTYDTSFSPGPAEQCYNSLTLQNGRNVFCSHFIFDGTNLFYCDSCYACKDCFGCSGLRHKQYCVFNKQYTETDYRSLVARITDQMKKLGEWGEFFPSSHSPFAYNESSAYEYYPLTKEQALVRGYRWREPDAKEYRSSNYTISDDITVVDDAILKAILACNHCGKNYKLLPPELQFYRQEKLFIPKQCPDCRHLSRMRQRNPRQLWQRSCPKCQRAMPTSYVPARPEQVYCQECYNKAIY